MTLQECIDAVLPNSSSLVCSQPSSCCHSHALARWPSSKPHDHAYHRQQLQLQQLQQQLCSICSTSNDKAADHVHTYMHAVALDMMLFYCTV